jgi:hypothetical protein
MQCQHTLAMRQRSVPQFVELEMASKRKRKIYVRQVAAMYHGGDDKMQILTLRLQRIPRVSKQ